ncbi:hypothetical protein WMF04_27675 [Sorangium sp. So ce260]|uniref:hypothetical protein n=1 Tax=Sorangium sp. So ce260 TaxID=3133291 RepID=UPI003F6377BC
MTRRPGRRDGHGEHRPPLGPGRPPMRRRSIHVVPALCGLIAAHALASGCGTLVKVGEGSADESGATASSTGVGGADPGPAEPHAIALLRSQLPDTSGSSGSESTGSGEPALDPNDLFIIIGNRELSCADPSFHFICGKWEVSISIPPALQVPGVIPLDTPGLGAYASVAGPDRGGGDCYGGGGSFFDGTIEIVSIDAEKVVVRFEDTSTFDFDANGEHTALRCP